MDQNQYDKDIQSQNIDQNILFIKQNFEGQNYYIKLLEENSSDICECDINKEILKSLKPIQNLNITINKDYLNPSTIQKYYKASYNFLDYNHQNFFNKMCDNKQVLMTVICSAEKKLLLAITTFDNNVFDQNQKYEDIGDINIFIFDVYKGYQESGQNMMIIGDNFVKGVDPRLKMKSNQQIIQKSSLSLDGQIHQQEQKYQEKMKIREQTLAEQNKQYQLKQEKNIKSNEAMKSQLEKLKLEIQKYEDNIFKIQPDYQENQKNLKEINQKLMILEEYKKKHEIQNKKLVISQIKLMEQKLDEVLENR
ncbi:hypothetical protein PPERSA_03440 [Pseudocohnilembus persalinus]|uniref:Uncharacterized protein n=1 Tax=Pseudocohnilembus persalinus TaxID=266149 RepID=A0A0V0QC19_PSEPJ|nr:hypothetical protein PPERSA_03440 [Pseudocohnilembus persalinus]|eukprot:KRW99639.1 hypothetical protein PPERSA_03440 [Pseudocohnilembus persalinus]